MTKGINVEKYCATGNYLDYCRYARERNLLKSLTRKLRNQYDISIARNMKSNPKAFWSYVNSKTKTKTSLSTLISHDSTEALSDADKVEVLNQFFCCSVFTKESLHNIPEFPPREFANEIDKVHITPELVHNKLKSLIKSKQIFWSR